MSATPMRELNSSGVDFPLYFYERMRPRRLDARGRIQFLEVLRHGAIDSNYIVRYTSQYVLRCYGGSLMMVCGTRRFQRRGHWAEFGMMGMRARFFGPGEVRLALLSLIADGPKHGYELMRQLEERSGGIYSASAGTVYPTLQQLEDEGLISSDSKEGKRVYAITDAGAAERKREDETVRRIWWRARRWAGWRHANDPDAAEIRGPAERLVKAAFRAVAGETGRKGGLDKGRETFDRAMRDLDGMRDKP